MALNRNEVGLQFTISVDLGNSVRQLQSFQDQIRATAKRIQVDMAAAADTIRKTTEQTTGIVKNSLSNMSDAFSSVGGSLTAGLTAPLVALGAAAVKSATDFDRARNQITAMTGSVDEANKVIARLRELVQTTPGLTASFAQDAFGIFQSLGKVGQESIFNITQAIGELNAAVNLPDATAFARNITQIFSQGFERGDIKEALGQVPFFEELLKEGFGMDAKRLGELQKASQLTADEFVNGLAFAIRKRFPDVTQSITVEFQKTFGELITALRPLGDQIIKVLLPMFKSAVNIIKTLLEAFNNLSPGMQEFIVQVGLIVAAIGPAILVFGKIIGLIGSLQTVIGAIGGLGLLGKLGALASTIATFSMAHPVIAGVVVGITALIGLFTNWDTVVSVVQKNLKQIFANPWDWLMSKMEKFDRLVRSLLRSVGVEVADAEYKVLGKKPGYEMEGATPATKPTSMTTGQETAEQRAAREQNERLKKSLQERNAATTDALKKTVGRTIDFQKLVRQIVEEDNRQQLRIIEAQTGQRLALLKQRYDAEQISQREFAAESLRLQMEQANREMAALGAEGDRLRRDQARTKSAEERLTIERELVRVTGEQAVKLVEIDRLLQERAQRETLPVFQIDPAQVQQAIEQVDPLLQAFRDRQAARAEEVARLEVDAIRTRTEIIGIENQVDLGMMTRTQAQERINALLKQERDQRIAALQIQLQSLDISEQQRASLEQQIAQLQTQGETARTGGFMEGLSQMSAGIGDLSTMALQAFDSMAQGMGQLIEQFAMTGQIGAQAFRQLAASVVAGLAKQAAVKAIYELAEGFAALALAAFGVPNAAAAAAGHFKAAALFGAVSGAAVATGRAIAPGGASESGGTGGRFVTGGGGQPQTISLIQGQQGNRREPQVVIIRAEMEPGVVIRKVADSYKENGEMRQLIRQDILQGAI